MGNQVGVMWWVGKALTSPSREKRAGDVLLALLFPSEAFRGAANRFCDEPVDFRRKSGTGGDRSWD